MYTQGQKNQVLTWIGYLKSKYVGTKQIHLVQVQENFALKCLFSLVVRKRAVPYDISWNGHLDQNGGRMSSRMPNRMRSSSRYSKTDIPEEDDDYYDEDDDDEDYEYADNR